MQLKAIGKGSNRVNQQINCVVSVPQTMECPNPKPFSPKMHFEWKN